MHFTKFGTIYRMLPGFQNQVILKMPRHAQTQHGDATVDEENIVLLKNILYQPVSNSEPLICTWFYNVDPNIVPVRTHVTAVNNSELKAVLPEKRKAEDVEQFAALKKARFETKALKAKRPGFSDDRYDETSYYFENGLRKVYPYYFTFTTFTKGRWVDEKILDVFSREFRAHPPEEYKRSILVGSLKVNYECVPVDYKLKHNDLLSNTVHRHEVPVTDQHISIVHMDEDIVVINKPASIPVHPCGRYRHNTVVFILAKEFNLKNLRTIHRLDRLTSGLLLFGRTSKKARLLEQQIRNRDVEKEYICRVEGNFPDGVIECKESIEVVSYKIGVCKVSPKGKECLTTFEKIGYNGTTSVLLCKPLTGRMHQIRVHLQYLGYPIVNDPLYNHEVFGPLKGRGGDIGGRTDEELVKDLIHVHNAENWLGVDGDFGSEGITLPKEELIANPNSLRRTTATVTSVTTTTSVPATVTSTDHNTLDSGVNENDIVVKEEPEEQSKQVTVGTQTGHDPPDITYNRDKLSIDEHCYECKVRFKDPKSKDLIMYLHAWKYRGPGWQYETQLPDWAGTNWKETEVEKLL